MCERKNTNVEGEGGQRLKACVREADRRGTPHFWKLFRSRSRRFKRFRADAWAPAQNRSRMVDVAHASRETEYVAWRACNGLALPGPFPVPPLSMFLWLAHGAAIRSGGECRSPHWYFGTCRRVARFA
eukprot:2903418-Pleurochrysis_carterae.AAC.1